MRGGAVDGEANGRRREAVVDMDGWLQPVRTEKAKKISRRKAKRARSEHLSEENQQKKSSKRKSKRARSKLHVAASKRRKPN